MTASCHLIVQIEVSNLRNTALIPRKQVRRIGEADVATVSLLVFEPHSETTRWKRKHGGTYDLRPLQRQQALKCPVETVGRGVMNDAFIAAPLRRDAAHDGRVGVKEAVVSYNFRRPERVQARFKVEVLAPTAKQPIVTIDRTGNANRGAVRPRKTGTNKERARVSWFARVVD